MQLTKIKDFLEAEVLCGEESLGMEVKRGCGSDLMSHVLASIKHDSLILLTGLANSQVIYISDAVFIKAVCFVDGNRPSEETVQLGRKRNMVLMASNLPMYEACGILYREGLAGYSELE